MTHGTTIYEDAFQRISFDEGRSLLTLTWLERSHSMNYPQFQGSLFIFAGFALDTHPRAALIETRQFGASTAVPDMEAMTKWRDANIIPVYNRAGIKKFAFAHGPGSEVPPNDGAQPPGYEFPTRHFTSEEDALAWLGE